MTFRWRKVVQIKDMSCQLKEELGVIWKREGRLDQEAEEKRKRLFRF